LPGICFAGREGDLQDSSSRREASRAAARGEKAQFRLVKDKMLLRVEDLDSKEREYIVVSMTPRADSSTAEASPSRLNHLQ